VNSYSVVRHLISEPSTKAGVTTIVPGGALNAVDCFGANSNPLAATSKVWF